MNFQNTSSRGWEHPDGRWEEAGVPVGSQHAGGHGESMQTEHRAAPV